MFENKELPKIILRISLSLVFLYFGFSQVISSDDWVGYVPEFLVSIIPANTLVLFNGILEISLGIMLLIGLYTRFASFILSIHLFLITLSIGFTPTGVRDFGLALATAVIFLNGPDNLTLDYKLTKK